MNTITVDELRSETRKPHWATRAHGRSKQRGEMNSLEKKYVELLEHEKSAGIILWWAFEAITLTLTHGVKGGAKGSRITCDFFVMLADGSLECREVKGFRCPRQLNALKVAAEAYPFRFVMAEKMAKKNGGGWRHTEF